MLYIVSQLLPNIASITAVKLPAIFCDFICAWYVFRIVRMKYEKGPISIFAYLAILFAPTVILNSAAWAQIESIYTAALVAFLFYILKKQPWFACITFGIAFTIKFQSIYLISVLICSVFEKSCFLEALINNSTCLFSVDYSCMDCRTSDCRAVNRIFGASGGIRGPGT